MNNCKGEWTFGFLGDIKSSSASYDFLNHIRNHEKTESNELKHLHIYFFFLVMVYSVNRLHPKA